MFGWVICFGFYVVCLCVRYGDMFLMRVVNEVDWVMLSCLDYVCEVFIGDLGVLYVGEGNVIFKLLFGLCLVLLFDGVDYLCDCKVMLLVFYGEWM